MAKFMQIIDVDTSGAEIVLHPESNADFIVAGSTYKVPTIININDWLSKSTEIVSARKGKASLKTKIDEIDTALLPENLLTSIKKVDGSGSGLDADLLDGRTVDDANDSDTSLWTAKKISTELAKKLNGSEVVTIAAANKILKLDANGLLPTGITKNSATTSRFINDLSFNFIGDVTGSVTFNGSERSKNISLEVINNSHTHNLLSGSGAIDISNETDSNIVNFKSKGNIKSYIEQDGSFSGSSAFVNGYKVRDGASDGLWTGGKIEQYVEQEIMQYAKKENGIAMIGPSIYVTGELDITNAPNVTIDISDKNIREDAELFVESYTITSDDSILSYVKSPSSTRNNISLSFNKIPSQGSKIKWSLVFI